MGRARKSASEEKADNDDKVVKITVSNMTLAAAVVIVLIVAIAAVVLYGGGPVTDAGDPKTYEEVQAEETEREEAISGMSTDMRELIESRTSDCLDYNPGLDRTACLDLTVRDLAIERDDESLCEHIITEDSEEMCRRYFSLQTGG